MNEQMPLTAAQAVLAEVKCAVATAGLLAKRRVHVRTEHVGELCQFADGTTSRVYRETIVDRPPTADPAVLIVGFRLRGVHGRRAHALFRFESLLNTPLFVGFPGFVSKLWMAHDSQALYRGVYEWDGPHLAEDYARALWRVLALVSAPGSVRYQLLPGLRRDDLLRRPELAGPGPREWWRLTGTQADVE